MPRTPSSTLTPVVAPTQEGASKNVAPTEAKITPRVLKARKAADQAMQKLAAVEDGEKARRLKTKQYRFPLTPAEHDALVAMKHVISDMTGSKVKKSLLMRVAVKLLLKQPATKLVTELSSLAKADAAK